MCCEIFFFCFLFQPFNNMKNILSLWGIQKQMVNWIWSMVYNLPTPELECYVIQGTAHTSFSPGLHEFCLVEIWSIVFTSVYLMTKSSSISSVLLDQLYNLSDSVSSVVKWGRRYLLQVHDRQTKFYLVFIEWAVKYFIQ